MLFGGWKNHPMDKTVVITGIGVVSPFESGRGIDIFWDKALKGECKIQRISFFNVDKYVSKVGAEVRGFDNQKGPNNKWIQIATVAFENALKDASLKLNNGVGLSVGTILGGILIGEKHWRNSTGSHRFRLPKEYQLSSGTDYFVEKYGIKGPSVTVSTACASGTDAIGIAYRKIMSGKADVMIAGGVDVINEFAFSGFNILQALTREKVRPFDKKRDGLAPGEGAGFVILEKKDSAIKRKVKIYGEILGYASRGDAHHLTGPDQKGRGLSNAISASLRESGLAPSQVDYINAHGTGTVYNDLMETKAIKHALGKHAYHTPISSIKGMIGHSFGAAGAIEVVTCLLAIRDGMVPPTINYREQDPDCDLDYVPNEARKHKVKTAISLSAGFGGQNAAIVLGDVEY